MKEAIASTTVAAPTYISIPAEITVNRPAADVWKRIGKFCDIGEWFQISQRGRLRPLHQQESQIGRPI